MDPVDVLTFSVTAAQFIRSSRAEEEVLAAAFRHIGHPPPDPAEPMAVRIARLADLAGDRRGELRDFLQERSGPLPLNRPLADPDAELAEADPEAVRLVEYAEEHEQEGVSMFGERPFSAFRMADRSASGYFGGPIIRRDGELLTGDEAGDDETGDEVVCKDNDLPPTVRCVLDYPLEVPVLFTIETGRSTWDLWEICCAIAEQYARVYEQPERHGVWGHDVTDLYIENLVYYPKERLIYPHIGS